MPPRSNDFQKLVFAVKNAVAGSGATVTESKMLRDLQTGDEREVDVCIETAVAGHAVTVCFECRDHRRAADVSWVEQMQAKHGRLPTNTLVLASRSGFSKRAVSLARVAGIQLLPYTAATEEQLRAAVNVTREAQVVTLSLNATKVLAVVPAADDLPEERVNTIPQNIFFDEKGNPLGQMHALVGSLLRSSRVHQLFQDVDESHTFFRCEVTPVAVDDGQPVFIEKASPRRLRQVIKLEVHGACRIRRTTFKLAHASLGPVRVAWGGSVLDGRDALLVAVQKDDATTALSLHVGEPPAE